MTAKRKILFVDDEAHVLSGLRRMLHSMCDQWDMTFAQSGPEVLDILKKNPFDVIIADMCMPQMHGSELLAKIKNQYPHISRIALSGQTTRESILRSVGPIHQFLSKPCDAETLKAAVNRVCSLRDLLAVKSLQNVIKKIESLPTLASHYDELIEEVLSPVACIKSVSRIISQDMALAAKVLQLVNSPIYGVRYHVAGIEQAVSLLGLNILKSLVLSVHAFSRFNPARTKKFSLENLWQHSLTVGEYARKIAAHQKDEQKNIDYALLAGMFHEVGQLILASELPQKYQDAVTLAQKENIELHEAQLLTIGASHEQLGAYLLGLWGFSKPIIDAVLFQHQPRLVHDRKFTVLTALHVANAFAHENDADKKTPQNISYIDDQYLQQIGLTDRLPKWRELCPHPLDEKKMVLKGAKK